jgi:hypothetical protein
MIKQKKTKIEATSKNYKAENIWFSQSKIKTKI